MGTQSGAYRWPGNALDNPPMVLSFIASSVMSEQSYLTWRSVRDSRGSSKSRGKDFICGISVSWEVRRWSIIIAYAEHKWSPMCYKIWLWGQHLFIICAWVVCDCEGMHCIVWLSLCVLFWWMEPLSGRWLSSLQTCYHTAGVRAHKHNTTLCITPPTCQLICLIEGKVFPFSFSIYGAFHKYTLRKKGTKVVTGMVPFQKVHL